MSVIARWRASMTIAMGKSRWRERAVVVAAAALVFSGTPAVAMGVRQEKTVIARGQDGSKLVELRSFGPEGGGALAYRFERGRNPAASLEYVLSSDFSPGGPTRPQTVSASECRQRVEAIAKQLSARGYPEVSVSAKPCAGKNRWGLVVVKGRLDPDDTRAPDPESAPGAGAKTETAPP